MSTHTTPTPVRREQQTCSAGGEREILVTIFVYDHEAEELKVPLGRVMRDLRCTYYSTCELKQKFFSIGTDAYATDAECVARFIESLKASGISIARHEWTTPPNETALGLSAQPKP